MTNKYCLLFLYALLLMKIECYGQVNDIVTDIISQKDSTFNLGPR
jgi:hypothetical protein